MRLIDADAIKLKKGFFENINNVPKFFEWLGKQPTIDAVEVVRCEDCKWHKTMFCKMDRWTDLITVYVAKADDYCSYSKRREE